MGLPLMPIRETVQVDTSLPFGMEVIREMGFPERFKTIGLGGLSSSFSKHDGEFFISELSNLQRSIWAKYWYEPVIYRFKRKSIGFRVKSL